MLINKNRRESKDVEIEQKINGKEKSEKTLLELFGEEGKKENKKSLQEKKEKKSRKKTKAEKLEDQKKEESNDNEKEAIFTRRDFLKDFKNFDPDKESGKENREPSDKSKKDVVITLTSKMED